MNSQPAMRSRAVSPENSTNYIIELMVVFCLMGRMGFPGNLALTYGGERFLQLANYGSSFLQLVLIMLCSGSTLLEIRLIDLKRKYLPVYLMLLLMFALSLAVSANRGKQTTIILHFSITALFGLWLADNYEPKHLLELIYYAMIGIVIANLSTRFLFRAAGYHMDEGYGYTFRGLYAQKNGLGLALATGLTFQVTLLRMKRERGEGVSKTFWFVLLAQIYLLWISKATTAIFCCLVPILYHGFYGRLNAGRTGSDRGRIQWGVAYAVITVGFLFIAMTILPLFAPLLEAIGKDATLSERTPMWEKIIAFLTEHNTFTGYGLLQFWETPSALNALHTYYERNSWYRTMAYGAHSNLLEMWLDLGLVGVGAYFVTIIACFQDVKRLTRDEYILASVILLPLLISGLTDRIFTNENAQTLFFFVMLGMACRGRDRRREANRSRLRRRSTPEPLPERGQRP